MVLKNEKKNHIFFLGFLAFVIIINWVPFMRIFVGEYWYYSNYDGSFRDMEVLNKGRTLESVKRRYKYFIQDHPEKRIDTNLYINDKKNYLKFWNYRDYEDHPRWHLPYKPTDSLTAKPLN